MPEIPADAIQANGLIAARPALIRSLNEQLLLDHIRSSGPYSRADLARVSGLSKPTVSLALANLERAGLVQSAGQRTGVPGRTALLYEVRPEVGFVLGLDIGLRYLRGAVADLAGEVRARVSMPVRAVTLGDRVAELVELADELCVRAGITRAEIIQTVVGSPGVYDPRRDRMALTGGLPGWNQPEALTVLRAAFGPALAIENDVNAATLAERALGVGQEVENFAFVHVGTGIGMGLVLGGRLYRGVRGVAGEIAFMPLGGDPQAWADLESMAAEDTIIDPADARRRGTLETAAGADGVVRAAGEAGLIGLTTARSVFEAAAAGNERAAAVVDREARLIAAAVCCVISVVDPSLIVLGGGIGQAPGFAEAVSAALAKITPVLPEVKVSALGTEAIVDGCLAEAAAIAWTQLVTALPLSRSQLPIHFKYVNPLAYCDEIQPRWKGAERGYRNRSRLRSPAGDMIRFSHGAATSVGRVRQVNEDSYLAVPPLFVVADGMGGHGSGDLASRIAIEDMSACAALRPLFAEAVLTALEHANQHIIERDAANRMGTTATGLAALETAGGDHLMVFNIGDSRVYRLSGDRLEQLTVDHSEVQELVLAGVITREQARTHPRRNVVTRALGSDAGLLPDHWLLPVIRGDRYLICSDGLFGELPDNVILPLLAVGSPQQSADALVIAANDAGGRDNVTAVVVDIDSGDDGAGEMTLPREVLPRITPPGEGR